MKEVEKILDKNEKVFWEGAPQGKPYVLRSLGGTIVGVFLLMFLVPFFVVPFLAKGAPIWFMGSFMIIPLIFLFFALAALLSPLWAYLNLRNTYFAITNKRVIIQKGIIGRDFEYIDFDQITNAEVNVGFWDKVAGNNSGSILISSAGSFTYGRHEEQTARPYTLGNIGNPYEVFKLFKDIGHAVKTDIQFPNKYRSSQNPGYNSNYKPK